MLFVQERRSLCLSVPDRLKPAEKNYSAMELEALAMVASIEHFAHYLYGREFVVQTDHKALVKLLTSKCLNK